MLTGFQGVDRVEDAWRTGNKAALFEDFNTGNGRNKDSSPNTGATAHFAERHSLPLEPFAKAAVGVQCSNHARAAEASDRSGSDKAASRPIEPPVQVVQSKHSEGERYPQRPIRVSSPLSSSIFPPTRTRIGIILFEEFFFVHVT